MKKWGIVFRVNEGDKQTVKGIVNCKLPSRTKIYRNLEKDFDKGLLFSYGYRQINN